LHIRLVADAGEVVLILGKRWVLYAMFGILSALPPLVPLGFERGVVAG